MKSPAHIGKNKVRRVKPARTALQQAKTANDPRLTGRDAVNLVFKFV